MAYVIALEDRRFFSHKGFDVYSIIRVFSFRLFGVKKGGASTIGQQLARTITNDREKKLSRKFREIILASQIERKFTKLELIGAYLNIAYFGSHLTGAIAFSKHFFKKDIYNLNDYELSIVAASLRYPCPKYPNKEWHEKINRRAEYARQKALQRNWIKKSSLIFQI